jgi:hypothetical protein
MWNQLGVFGSRVVEAISVASVDETRMEGNDANALIASRMGIEPGDVTARLVTLHQKNELNGAADGRADNDDDDVVRDVNVSLTLGDLEDFERFEKMTAAEKLVPPKTRTKDEACSLGCEADQACLCHRRRRCRWLDPRDLRR